MKEEGRRKKTAAEGIVTQGRDGSLSEPYASTSWRPSGPTFAWKGGTGVSPVYDANLGTSSTGLAPNRSTRPRRPCPLFSFTLPPHFPAELPQAIESMKQKFDNRGRCGGLADPEKEHPLDDFGFYFRPVLLGHQSFGEVFFLLVKSDFQAFGNSSGFWIRGFQNTKNLCGAHGKKFSKCLIPFVASVHSNLLNHLSLLPFHSSLSRPPYSFPHSVLSVSSVVNPFPLSLFPFP